MTKNTFVKLASGETFCCTTTTSNSLITRLEAAIAQNPNDQALPKFLKIQRKGANRFNRKVAGRTAKQISEG